VGTAIDFKYEAVNAQGQAAQGQISAQDAQEAMRLLQQQGLTPTLLESAGAGGVRASGKRSKASTQDKRLMMRELATLLKAGVPLGEAVESLASAHQATQVGEALDQVHAGLRAGERFSLALKAAGLGLPEYVIQMASAAEMTGKLAEALADAATQMEYEETVRSEMRNALIYPSVLVFSGIGATLLTFVVVVPKFANMLKSSRADLPALSVWVLQTGLFVKANLLWLGLGVAAVVMGLVVMLSNPVTRMRVWERLVHVPLIGRWLVEIETGKWAALLGILLENRVPIVRAMELAQEAVRLGSMRMKLQGALRDIRAGKRLADALASTGILAATGINLIRVGERSGALAPMLRALATLYETAARVRLKRFLILLEPAAILIIGGVIGTIMIAIMMAITGLSTAPG